MADNDWKSNKGNVVQLFGKKPPREVARPPLVAFAVDGDELAAQAGFIEAMNVVPEALRVDHVYALSHGSRLLSMLDKMNVMIEFLTTLAGFQYHRATVELRRDGMKVSLEELCNQIDQSHQLQWTARPSTYYALVKELRERVGQLQPYLPKE